MCKCFQYACSQYGVALMPADWRIVIGYFDALDTSGQVWRGFDWIVDPICLNEKRYEWVIFWSMLLAYGVSEQNLFWCASICRQRKNEINALRIDFKQRKKNNVYFINTSTIELTHHWDEYSRIFNCYFPFFLDVRCKIQPTNRVHSRAPTSLVPLLFFDQYHL